MFTSVDGSRLGSLLKCVYAYDERLIEAARSAGLRVLAPTDENPDGDVVDRPTAHEHA